MNFKLIFGLSILSSLCFVSCDRPECVTDNSIFIDNEPNTKIYKDELVKQLNTVDQTKLTYWLQKYDEQDDEESLYFYIQGDGLCAILHLTMNHWDKLESVREKKGIGRRGAEFRNLKFDIVQDSLSTTFIYTSYDMMID
jgi:hypothetical protein